MTKYLNGESLGKDCEAIGGQMCDICKGNRRRRKEKREVVELVEEEEVSSDEEGSGPGGSSSLGRDR